jgi:hypothetical protein
MPKRRAGSGEITVVLPPEPPELNTEAARVLLRILLKAYEKQFGSDETATADSQLANC